MKHINHTVAVVRESSCKDNRRKGLLYGFMLIELIIAVLISSLVSGVLLTALYQSNRIQVTIDDMIDLSERVAIVYSQLEKDLAGSFVPEQAESSSAKASDFVKTSPDKSADESQQNTQASTAQSTSEKTGQAQKQKPIEKIFYATNKDGMLDTLTFVTNNPLVVFVGKDVGYVKPKVVRVQYTLRQESDKKNSYALFRQEANEINLEEFKNARTYEVIGGIKKLTATYTARLKKEADSSKTSSDKLSDKQSDKKKSYEYKVQSDWISEKKEANTDKDKKEPEFPRIPYNVEFKMTLWDKQENKDKEFTLICHIPVDSIEAKKEDKKQKEPMQQPIPKSDEDDKSQQQGQGNSSQKIAQNRTTQSGQRATQNSVEMVSNAAKSIKNLLGRI